MRQHNLCNVVTYLEHVSAFDSPALSPHRPVLERSRKVKVACKIRDDSRKAETCSRYVKYITSIYSLYWRNRILNILFKIHNIYTALIPFVLFMKFIKHAYRN
jgi:hypothetical protein